MEDKKWYKSKTLWINVLLIVVGLATTFIGELQAGVTLTGAGIINTVLRVVSSTKLSW